jgi:hypothetical protein
VYNSGFWCCRCCFCLPRRASRAICGLYFMRFIPALLYGNPPSQPTRPLTRRAAPTRSLRHSLCLFSLPFVLRSFPPGEPRPEMGTNEFVWDLRVWGCVAGAYVALAFPNVNCIRGASAREWCHIGEIFSRSVYSYSLSLRLSSPLRPFQAPM